MPTFDLGKVVGPQGPQGETGPAGAQGIQGEKGDKGDQGIQGAQGPAGAAGAQGPAGTIEIGTVTASAAGGNPSVTNSGTSTAAVLNFVLPRGEAGPQGATGPQGPQGPQGDPGDGISQEEADTRYLKLTGGALTGKLTGTEMEVSGHVKGSAAPEENSDLANKAYVDRQNALKQDKLTGTQGQIVGFDSSGNAIAQAAPASGVTSFKGRTGAVTPANGDYTAEMVGAVPTTRKINNKALSADVTLAAGDVGAVPTSRTVNGKALSSNISLTASDVGAYTKEESAEAAENAIEPVGTIKATVRTDLGDKWLLCNGDKVDSAEYPELYNYLQSKVNTEFVTSKEQSVSTFGPTQSASIRSAKVLGDYFVFFISEWDQRTQWYIYYVKKDDPNKTVHKVEAPTINGTAVSNGSYVNGQILLFASHEDFIDSSQKSFTLKSTTDFEDFTDVTITLDSTPYYDSCVTGITYNGNQYLIAIMRYNYDTQYLYYSDSLAGTFNFASNSQITGGATTLITSVDGYFVIIAYSNSSIANLYVAQTMETQMSWSSVGLSVNMYDNIPYSVKIGNRNFFVVGSRVYYLDGPEINANNVELLSNASFNGSIIKGTSAFAVDGSLGILSTNGEGFSAVYFCGLDADTGDKVFDETKSLGGNSGKTILGDSDNFIIMKSSVNGDAFVFEIYDTKIKLLPLISPNNAYAYIKAKE